MRYSLFWDVTQRSLVVFTDVSGPLKMGHKETSVTITLRCVTSQKSEYLICTAAEACNNATVIDIAVNN